MFPDRSIDRAERTFSCGAGHRAGFAHFCHAASGTRNPDCSGPISNMAHAGGSINGWRIVDSAIGHFSAAASTADYN